MKPHIRKDVATDREYISWEVAGVEGGSQNPPSSFAPAPPVWTGTGTDNVIEEWKNALALILETHGPLDEAGIVRRLREAVPDSVRRKALNDKRKVALDTLHTEGFVRMDGAGRYSLGPEA
jgi:hypothetical protein